MVTTDLRRRAEAALTALGLSDAHTNEQVKAALEERNGRQILIQTAPSAVFVNAACGAWIESDTVDVILVPEDADPLLQAHTVRHEFGHMILRHHGITCGKDTLRELVARTMPDLDPDKVVAMLSRSQFTGADERDAEMIASLLTLRATHGEQALQNTETEALRRALAGALHRG